MTEEQKQEQRPISKDLSEAPERVEVTEEGRDVTYQHNGRSLEGKLVPMPLYMRSALMQGRREALGYTLEYVAERLGVNKSTIQRYENGKIKKIPNDVLDKLEDLYSISLRETLLDNGKVPERTEQTVPIAIVREYPKTMEQQMHECVDAVEHFHYDITVKHDVLYDDPLLMQRIEYLVMSMGKLDYMAKSLLEDLINYILVQQENQEMMMRSAQFASASKVYDMVSDSLPQEQKEALWDYIVNDMSRSIVKLDAK